MLSENNEIAYDDAWFEKQKQCLMYVYSMCENENFKVNKLFKVLKLLNRDVSADELFKSLVQKCIDDKIRHNSESRKITNEMMQSLNDYKMEQPETFEKLVEAARDTKKYNDIVFRIFIFMVCHYSCIIKTIMRNAFDISDVFRELTTSFAVLMQPTLKRVSRAVSRKYNKIKKYFDITVFYTLEKIKCLTKNQSIEAIMSMDLDPIKQMLREDDSVGAIIPMSSYICYDIIVERVNTGKIKIPYSWKKIIAVAVFVLMFITVVGTICLIVHGSNDLPETNEESSNIYNSY
jgi:hypothetical protein